MDDVDVTQGQLAFQTVIISSNINSLIFCAATQYQEANNTV